MKIFTPLLYLKLQNEALDTYTWCLPLGMTVFFGVLAQFLPEGIKVYSGDGLIRSINQLLSVLVAFYIASLAAIATFKSDHLDSKFAGNPMELTVVHSGKEEIEDLSRRRFLCLLFAYCAYVALILFCIGEMAILLKGNVSAFITNVWGLYLGKLIFTLLYTFAISNLLSTTLLGLHYLADRIHRP